MVQLPIGNMLANRGIIAFPNDGGLVATLGQVPVHAVVTGIQGTVFKPLNTDLTSRK
ncbi:MAG: Uncharacterised protein [Pseudidiomarina mangrovi]|nr:MAG: Uncharacterised protein [Pseudidiomarina mangrovi]